MKAIALLTIGALCGAAVVSFILVKRAGPSVEYVAGRAQPMAPAAPVQPQKSMAPGATAAAPSPATPEGYNQATRGPADRLQTRLLMIPVAGTHASQLNDSFNQSRGGGRHEAIDIPAPKGTPVVAVDDGRVVKLFNSKPGGLTVYQFDPDEKLAYYYAHLDSYAPGLAEGRQLKRGDLVGSVGSTGNANPAAPHLHFAIFELGAEKRWWQGTPINPFPLFTGH